VKSGYLSEIFVSFQGEGAHLGRRHLFVRLAGCNLRCRYCDTPDSLERMPEFILSRDGTTPERRANPVPAPEAAALIQTILAGDRCIDAVAVTGGEPLAQSEFVSELLQWGNFGVPVLLETAGVLARRLPDILPWVDIVSMDIKLPSNTGERPFWDEHAVFLEHARGKDLYVKVLVDEGSSDQDVERAASLVAVGAPASPVFVQPIVDAVGRPCVSPRRLTDLFMLIRRHVTDVRVVAQTHKVLGIQ
jgi:organic radical activating enzyme